MTRAAVKGDGYKDLKLKVHGKDSFSLGKETIDLRYIEQIADPEQTAALGQMLKYAREHLIDNRKSLSRSSRFWKRSWRKRGCQVSAPLPIPPAVLPCQGDRKSIPVLTGTVDKICRKELLYFKAAKNRQ